MTVSIIKNRIFDRNLKQQLYFTLNFLAPFTKFRSYWNELFCWHIIQVHFFNVIVVKNAWRFGQHSFSAWFLRLLWLSFLVLVVRAPFTLPPIIFVVVGVLLLHAWTFFEQADQHILYSSVRLSGTGYDMDLISSILPTNAQCWNDTCLQCHKPLLEVLIIDVNETKRSEILHYLIQSISSVLIDWSNQYQKMPFCASKCFSSYTHVYCKYRSAYCTLLTGHSSGSIHYVYNFQIIGTTS